MSESPKLNPEISKIPEPSRGLARDPDVKSGSKTPEQLRQETLNSLGEDFNVGWDAFLSKADFSGLRSKLLNKDKTFNQEAFFEAINKLNPKYLEHIQRLLQEEMTAQSPEEDTKKYKSKEEKEREAEDRLANLAKPFINRVEFFSRLKPPETLTVGGKTREQLITEMEQNNIQISDYARQMMENEAFTTTKKPEETKLVRLAVKDLDFNKNPTTDQIYQKITELGLDLCSSEVGPHRRLSNKKQPLNDWEYIGMKQVPDYDGDLRVFRVAHVAGGLWLYDHWVLPTDAWDPEFQFVFSLRK